MSRTSSSWNIGGDRPAEVAERPPVKARAGWLRTLIGSATLFMAFFALLAWRMHDGVDPALLAKAKAKAKSGADSTRAAQPYGPEPSDSYGYGGYGDGYGYGGYGDPYGGGQSYYDNGGSGQYAPPPTTRVS